MFLIIGVIGFMMEKIYQLSGILIILILAFIPLGFAVDEIDSLSDMTYAEFSIDE